MKKLLFLSALFLISINLFSQKIIENPSFSASTAHYVSIAKIELYDSVTIVDFEVTFRPKQWIQVNKDKTYIQDSNGGEKLYVKRADGIELNERHWTPESGINNYTLYFPAIDNNVESIDFMEEEWKIFDIDLVGKESVSFIPEEIQGNWFKTDGSNEWVYGIFDDIVIYKSEIWNNVLLKNKGKSYQLTLRNDAHQESVFIKLKKENILIGDTPDNMELYSKNETANPDYVLKNDDEYKQPVFKFDTAIYKGYVNGYHPKMGATGIIYANNILTQQQDSYILEIESDGSFYCEIPMIHPQDVYLRLLSMNESIFLEPATETFHCINLPAYTAINSDKKQVGNQDKKSLFMGDLSRLNADMLAMKFIRYYNYNEAQKLIIDMTADEYKAYCLEIMEIEQKDFQDFTENNLVCKKAQQIKKLQIPYEMYQNILSFNQSRKSAYRKKNNVSREQREIPLAPEILKPDFFDFINADDLNNPISLATGGAYNHLINRIRFSENIRPIYNLKYIAFRDSLKQRDISLTVDESNSLDDLIECKDGKSIGEFFKTDTLVRNLFMIHSKLIWSITTFSNQQQLMKNFKDYFGIEKGLVTDIIYAQTECSRMKSTLELVDEQVIIDIKENISNSFIVDYLLKYIDDRDTELKEKIVDNKTKTGYVINDTPKNKGDKLFEAIIEKYKGKVIFVDFWATWCSPCRTGIERIKPLKEELKNKDIEFVYITNQTSHVSTWNAMIPDIRGEHYRLETDEWNYLASKFNISGIPHYVLVDKQGKVVMDKIYSASSIAELRKIFTQYLKL
jgi:thiol-disulfide isomerase/thioredoxin